MDNIKSIKIDNEYDLIPIILERLEEEYYVSVVADFETIWNIAEELYDDFGFEYNLIDVDRLEYDREYYLSISEDFKMCIERAYCDDKDRYLASSGIVYISENVSSKYITDCRSNVFIDDFTPIIFRYEYEEVEELEEDNECNPDEDDEYTKVHIHLVDFADFDDFIDTLEQLASCFFE